MIKAVFFDAAGILYRRSMPTEVYALDLLHRSGFAPDISEEQKVHLMQLREKANNGRLSHDAYWDQFLLFRGVQDEELRQDLYRQIVTFSNDVEPVPGAGEALTGLKEKGIVLGVITDTMYPLEWKMRRLEKAGVASLIDVIACSTDLGAHKPDRRVYQYALQQTRFAPAECAFVGHLDTELQGARSAGMTTIAIDQDPDAAADYYCASLIDLPGLDLFDQGIMQG